MTLRVATLCAALAGTLVLVLPAYAGPPVVHGVHAFLVEGPHGEVLAQQNANRQVPIASLTKLMTVSIALPHIHPDQAYVVPSLAVTAGESSVGLGAGQSISGRELLEAALVPSANDAADTLALDSTRAPSFSSFAAIMNARARALGLHHTHFDRPDGLSTGDESSARDITKLAQLDMRSPLVRSIVRMRSISIETGTFAARNNLLSTFPGAYGVKTGHTDAAGWCEVAVAERNGVSVYVTVLGAATERARDADLAQLLDWGLSRYRPAVVADPHRIYTRVPAAFGRSPVQLVAQRRVVRPVRAGRPVVERVVSAASVGLPVRAGQRLGSVTVSQNGRLVARTPLVAARAENSPGVFGRVGWYIGEAAHKVWSLL